MPDGVALPTDHLLLTTGAVTRYPDRATTEDFVDQLPHIADRALEVMIYPTWHLDDVAEALGASGAVTPVVHAEKGVGPDLSSGNADDLRSTVAAFETNCRFAQTIGASTIVVHLWGLPDSDHRLDNNLAGLPTMLDVAQAHGITMSVESILCDHGTALDALRRVIETDVRARFTLDLEFLAVHDQLDAALESDWLWPWVNHVHVKDYDGHMFDPDTGKRRYLHPGEGTLDLDGFLQRAVGERRYSGTVTLEVSALTDDGSIDWPRLQRSLEWLDSHAV